MFNILVLGQGMMRRSLGFSLGVMMLLTAAVCLFFVVRWQTSDDALMSMIAHGYGVAAYGSPNLYYSNVLWGYLVRAIPSFGGVLGYSWATLATLFVVGWALLYFLIRLGAGLLVSVLAVVLIMARPMLFPQFTIHAGLLAVAAVAGWQVYARFKVRSVLWIACVLAFLGYLIRYRECMLILGVALPLLPWRDLRSDRSLQVAFGALVLAMALASFLDHRAYSGSEWKMFKEIYAARETFDSGAGVWLRQRPDILLRHGYSPHDIDLLGAKFFIDPEMERPQALHAMLAELGPLFSQKGRINLGLQSVWGLSEYILWPLILAGAGLFALIPRKKTVVVWGGCLAALFAVGVWYRPALLHVCIPLVSLLMIAPLMSGLAQGVRRKIAGLVLLLSCVWNASILLPESRCGQVIAKAMQQNAPLLTLDIIFGSDSALLGQYLFPVFSSRADLRRIRWYSFDIINRAPFSVAMAEEKAGRSFSKLLCAPDGIVYLTNTGLERLRCYCEERLKGELQMVGAFQRMPKFGGVRNPVSRVRCRTGPTASLP